MNNSKNGKVNDWGSRQIRDRANNTRNMKNSEETIRDDGIDYELRAISQRKKSDMRKELEALLKNAKIADGGQVTVINLSDGQSYYFSNFPDAIDFMKANKGRWYVTTSGLRNVPDR